MRGEGGDKGLGLETGLNWTRLMRSGSTPRLPSIGLVSSGKLGVGPLSSSPLRLSLRPSPYGLDTGQLWARGRVGVWKWAVCGFDEGCL